MLCLNFTNCSKTVQQNSTLPWIYPETNDWTLATPKSIKDILKGENLDMSNNKGLLTNFFNSPEILSSRQFKGCPSLDLSITTTLTRQIRAATNPETFNL